MKGPMECPALNEFTAVRGRIIWAPGLPLLLHTDEKFHRALPFFVTLFTKLKRATYYAVSTSRCTIALTDLSCLGLFIIIIVAYCICKVNSLSK